MRSFFLVYFLLCPRWIGRHKQVAMGFHKGDDAGECCLVFVLESGKIGTMDEGIDRSMFVLEVRHRRICRGAAWLGPAFSLRMGVCRNVEVKVTRPSMRYFSWGMLA